MKRVRAFIYVYTKSLTSFAYYRDLLKTGFKFSVKYYLVLALITSIITSFAASFKVAPTITKSLENIINNTRDTFPEDLVFTVKNGAWSVNRPEPFIVPMPKYEGESSDLDMPKNLIVFDHNGTIGDLKTLDTLIIFNSVNVLYTDNNKINVMPLKDFPDNVVNKKEFDKLINSFVWITKALPLLIFVITLIVVLAMNIIFRAFYFAWISLFVWLASTITGVKLNYSQSVKVTIHSATLPITLNTLLGMTPLPNYPYWFSILNLLFAVLVLIDMKKFVQNK